MAVTVVGAALAEPLEGLEQPADLGGRNDGSGAGYRQHSAAVPGSGRDLNVTAGDVVLDGVVDQVGHQPFGQNAVTVECSGLGSGPDVQPEAVCLGAAGQQDLAGDGREVDGLMVAE